MSEKKYFFCHLQKTAGTALLGRLLEDFAPDEVYPDQAADGPDDDPIARVMVPEYMIERWSARPELRLLTGHFPLCTVERLPDEFSTFTLLRHPLDRTISLLRHQPLHTPEDRGKSLEELYDDPFRFDNQIKNHMTRMLSLTSEEMTGGMLTSVEFTPERLERAKQNLLGVDVFGVQEDFSGFCARLQDRFGWKMAGERFRTGVVPNRVTATSTVEIDPAFAERILADNADDLELYRFAAQRCGVDPDA